MKYLIEHDIIIPIEDDKKLKKGNIVRRVSDEKDQQGIYVDHDDKDGLILVNVIDMKNCAFAAEAGLLRHTKDDNLYVFTKSFTKNSISNKAREVLYNWSLFKKHKELQASMSVFLEHGYAPQQILDFDKTDNLKYLFIPLQEKFKIGRFEEKINWELERKERFKFHLDQLQQGEHITYVALIPPNISYSPLFYSIGTKPHETTVFSLQGEPFSFKATHGGHIKSLGTVKNKKKFLVDAGSKYLGKGVKSPINVAESICKAMARIYKDYIFTAIEGRGAFGSGQSY